MINALNSTLTTTNAPMIRQVSSLLSVVIGPHNVIAMSKAVVSARDHECADYLRVVTFL